MKKLHLVCNAHLDPVWLWQWEEGLGEALSTFRIAAEFCENYDGFVFNHNEALLYEWVEEFEPALFRRIQELVKAGKWHIMGGWYIQPDCNMPSGESFTRQILYGKRYFMEKFGVEPTTAINFDPFGHTRGLVQIMAKSGYDSYIFCRPDVSLKKLPGEDFIWVGFDGSEIKGHRSYRFYLSQRGKSVSKIKEFIEKYPDRNPGMVLWGIGNHGGGPSREDLESIQNFRNENKEYEVLHSTPESYFKELSQTGEILGKFEESINPFAVGCYTSQIRIKQKHRKLENELYAAEKMMSAAEAIGVMKYDKNKTVEALKDLMFCEFHDILPGSSIQVAEEDAIRMLDHGLEIASRLKAAAFFNMMKGDKKAEDRTLPIYVYNPHPWTVNDVFTCEYMNEFNDTKQKFSVPHMKNNSKDVACQDEREASSLSAYDWRKRVVFKGELKPFSMNRFDLTLEALDKKPAMASYEEDGYININTDDLIVKISTKTGLVEELTARGVKCLSNGARPVVIKDNADAWGMLVDRFTDIEGYFGVMEKDEAAKFVNASFKEFNPVRVTEDGEVRTVVEAYFKYNNSRICLTYIIPRNGTSVDINARVFWAEADRMLKIEFPTGMNNASYKGQAAWGVDTLPADGGEAVAQKWVAAISGGRTFAVLNDCQYGSSFSDGNIMLTLLRSPAYSGHPIGDNPIVIEDRYTPRIDQGERMYSFRLIFGSTADVMKNIERKALEFNERPMVLTAYPSGEGAMAGELMEISGDQVILQALKKAENGIGYIIRLFNGSDTERTVDISSTALKFYIKVSLGAMEVASYRIIDGRVIKTDLLEREL
ncbi:MAG: alpha-mannosidase [Clostridia bacterium]|nr:alpha-mannosidase [Clostridia bacterium]MBN2883127.1 alpha-mannosidase [Clostridia bacterium]